MLAGTVGEGPTVVVGKGPEETRVDSSVGAVDLVAIVVLPSLFVSRVGRSGIISGKGVGITTGGTRM